MQDSIANYYVCDANDDGVAHIKKIRSLPQPYSTSPSTVFLLFLLSFHRGIQSINRRDENCIESTPFCAETKFASLLLKTVWVGQQQNGGKICIKIGLTRNFLQMETSQKLLHGEHFPYAAQAKRYSLASI